MRLRRALRTFCCRVIWFDRLSSAWFARQGHEGELSLRGLPQPYGDECVETTLFTDIGVWESADADVDMRSKRIDHDYEQPHSGLHGHSHMATQRITQPAFEITDTSHIDPHSHINSFNTPSSSSNSSPYTAPPRP